jgi:hypothetical protein
VHGYTVAFVISGSIFIVGAITVFSLIRPLDRSRSAQVAGAPVPAAH